MTRKFWRSRGRRLVAIAGVLVVVLTFGHATTALADTPNPITGTVNTSDPELIQCPRASGTGMTLCLFGSQDMGSASGLPIPYGQNYYPMYSTVLWRLNDGADPSNPANWGYVGATVTEVDVNIHGGVPVGADHLWAPGVRYWTPTFGTAKYYVYVPDVLDTNAESTSSRLFLFTSTEKSGANCTRFSCNYSYVGQVSSSTSQPNGGYQSDPMLFVDPFNIPYMVYANGDYSNCGGISIGRLGTNMISWAAGSPQPITINNWGDNLGNCGGTGHPYMEGAALYRSTSIGAPANNPAYTLIFAAKPPDNTVPTSCSGYPASDKEVIAYATSSTVTGPYNYGGIIMCGSTSEWTNQASVVQQPGTSRYLFAWHDGNGSYHDRRTHLMCLTWDSLGKPFKIPRSTTNMTNC